MLIPLVIIWILTLGYVVLMLVYWRGWLLQPLHTTPQDFNPKTKVSVIIPARNEEGNIGECVHSILSNVYPKELLEIIAIDDHSTDNTCTIVNNFDLPNVKCLKMQDFISAGEKLNAYKKKAIEIGIVQCTGELIITTDADCIVKKNWLRTLVNVYEQNKPVMIVAPVAFTNNGSVVETFQSIDFMSMQGITAAAHQMGLGNMSNGANLAFSKVAFLQVEGYKGVDHLASGDDFLLMMKLQRQLPGRIAYLKSKQAIVSTSPQPDWKCFFQQRIRWASKSGKYDDVKLTAILLFVYLFNLSFLVLFIAGFYNYHYWVFAAGMLVIKTVAEMFYLLPVSGFFKKTKELLWFPFLQPLHILYIISAGFLGLIGVYSWKGRSVR